MASLSQLRQASIFIDFEALRHNALLAKAATPNSHLLAVIKADAYGHGMIESAKTLLPVSDGFAVARLDEAIKLRELLNSLTKEKNRSVNESSPPQKPIVIMSALTDESTLRACVEYNITPLLYSNHNFVSNSHLCRKLGLPYWLKLDTGMHRLGLNGNDWTNSVSNEDLQPCKTVFTHFKSAEENRPESPQPNPAATDQLHHFAKTFTYLKKQYSSINTMDFSVSNSAAVLAPAGAERYDKWLEQALSLTQFNKEWIRPGIMLYGADPLDHPNGISQQLKAAMTFAAPIIDIRTVAKGEGVGYNGIWQAKRESTIATIGAGYADGYPRHAENGTPIMINGQIAKLVGRVSMDMIGVDISELVDHHAIKIGETAELWGPQLPVNTVAKHAKTIAYDLFTGITDRVQRLTR